MGFKGKKVYGSYKTPDCPFCGKRATQKNEQGLEVCPEHIKKTMQDIKCTCGSWLETRSGKFGPYFNCINCGNINYQKGLEMKDITMKDQPKDEVIVERKIEKTSYYKREPKEITITTDDCEYFD